MTYTICLKFTETGKLMNKIIKKCGTVFGVVRDQHKKELMKDID